MLLLNRPPLKVCIFTPVMHSWLPCCLIEVLDILAHVIGFWLHTFSYNTKSATLNTGSIVSACFLQPWPIFLLQVITVHDECSVLLFIEVHGESTTFLDDLILCFIQMWTACLVNTRICVSDKAWNRSVCTHFWLWKRLRNKIHIFIAFRFEIARTALINSCNKNNWFV